MILFNFNPEQCERLIDFMVNEAKLYFTPYSKRSKKNREKLRTIKQPNQQSNFSILANKPNHKELLQYFEPDYQRAFLGCISLLRKNESYVGQHLYISIEDC